jgi:hypothetical protein
MNVSLNFQGRAFDEYHLYAGAYREAAKALFARNFEPVIHSSLDILPIAFLYRHATELYLKAIARKGNALLSLHNRPQGRIQHVHTLSQLLADVKPIFEFMGPIWEKQHKGFRQLVADLEKDDVLGINDRSGDKWRYPVRRLRKGDDAETDHQPENFNFDVREFVTRLDGLTGVLSNACVYLDWALEHTYEMLSDHDPR